MAQEEVHCRLCLSAQTQPFAVRTTGETYHSCGICGLIFLDPRFWLPADAEKARYLLHNNDESDPGYLNFLRRLAEPMLAKLEANSEGLDFGAGPGPVLASYLRSQGHRVALYDPFFHPDPGALARDYDFITCTEAAEHFFDPKKEFDLLFRCLRPGGYLGMMTEFVFPDLTPEDFLKWYYAKDPSHVCFYQERSLEWIAEHYGVELEVSRKNVALFRRCE